MKQNNSQIKKALIKLASGYEYTETTEEYVPDEENNCYVLSKRKVSSHHVAPDIAAIKLLLSLDQSKEDLSAMSDEELLDLRKKLLEEIGGKIVEIK